MTDSFPHCIIIHGTGGSPEGNWFPWLGKELLKLKQGVSVTIPTFPTPDGQSLLNWSNAFQEQVGRLTENMVLIGHSMGVGMILRLLEKSPVKVRAIFLVSGWEGLLGNSDFDPLNQSFFVEPLNYQTIKKNMGLCTIYHGDDDPYVPLEMGKELAENLDSKLKVIQGGGHLNAEAGYHQFAELLKDIADSIVAADA